MLQSMGSQRATGRLNNTTTTSYLFGAVFQSYLKDFPPGNPSVYAWASLVAQTVKNLPAMWETRVCSLGWEDPLEKGMATYSRILA